MDFLGAESENDIRPGTAALRICNHLSFIQHCNIIIPGEVSHFHRGCLDAAVGNADGFLSGHQRTGNVLQVEILELFKGQQTERAEIDSPAGGFEAFHAFKGFA